MKRSSLMSESALPTHVQVGIVGAGPAGLLLGLLLAEAGVSCAIFERQTRAHVEGRIRAGVLEPGTVDVLTRAGVATRLARESLRHEGVEIAFGEQRLRLAFDELTGHCVTVYGQTELTRDLIATHLTRQSALYFEATVEALHNLNGEQPQIECLWQGRRQRVRCDFIAGCDGFHGVARASIPAHARREYSTRYPAGWLGLLSDTPPVARELIYARHDRGFALCSMRSPTRSRYYLEVAEDEALADWPEARFWEELGRRLPAEVAQALVTGPALEMSIAPLRSVVSEPLRHGRLLLAGDAAHIVPPTGAKGLNLALRDVSRLAAALLAFFHRNDEAPLRDYSAAALAEVWQAVRFSWWFTHLTHRLAGDDFAARLQQAEFAHLCASRAAQQALAEQYVGLR